MKMKYEKPMACVELYKLSQSIAACAIKISFLNNACVVADPDTPEETRGLAYVLGEYFTTVGGCDKDATKTQDNEKICYHTQVNAMFTS